MWYSLLVLVVVVGGGGGGAPAGDRHRYDAYGSVKMPLYGGGEYDAQRDLSDAAAGVDADDYHDRSPVAPASLDYKYEEEPKGNTEKPSLKFKEVVETADEWHKPARNQRRRTGTANDDYSDLLDKHRHDDIIPKHKLSRRYRKHRSRLKFKKSEGDPYSRGIDDHKDDNDEGSDVESEYEVNSNKRFLRTDGHMHDDIKFSHIKTTDRIIKRKPRDKERPNYSDDMQDKLIPDKPLKTDDEGDVDFRRDMILGRDRPLDDDSDDPRYIFDLERRRPSGSDSDDPRRVLNKERSRLHGSNSYESQPVQRPFRGKEKTNSEEYDEFYDMKRVLDIKNRLPDLIRRTKARGAAPRPTEELEQVQTNRRAFGPVKLALPESTPSPTVPGPDLWTTTITVSERSSRRVSTLTTRATTTTTAVVTTTETKGELSMAEKSRLSILKKILKKESDRNGPPIRKPAVLLQVTKKLPTVVMVEPATKGEPWMRAREVTEDSPTRVERAKLLMRNKLIANAKNIHDLTDNWDETVCEYIDLSMLDQMSAAPCEPSHVAPLITIFYFVVFDTL